MSKRKSPKQYIEDLRKLQRSGIKQSPPLYDAPRDGELEELESLEERVRKILGLLESDTITKGYMLFIIMYDITSNKARRNVVKYLERSGCMRIQKSIFLANLPSEKYQEIKDDLTIIQQMYENEDSIIICPISQDILKAMKIIGKNINIDIITRSKNTLFF